MEHALVKFVEGRPFGHMADFAQQVVRQRHARFRGSRFERAVQSVRHVAQLNHLRHAISIFACAEHVKAV